MASDLQARMEKMYRGDKIGAWSFVIALWLTVLFVLIAVWGLTDDGALRIVLAIAAGFVLLFNTAAIGAMVKHYRDDLDFVYGLDIHHLDANREARVSRSKSAEAAAE